MLCAKRVSCGDKQQSVMMALYGFGQAEVEAGMSGISRVKTGVIKMKIGCPGRVDTGQGRDMFQRGSRRTWA